MKTIEHQKHIEQAENEVRLKTFRRAIGKTEKRCNITIPDIDDAFRFGSITFNNTKAFTHTEESKVYKAKKKFKRSRQSKRVRFAMPLVNDVFYSHDSTSTKTPVEASVQHDDEAESIAVVEAIG